MSHSQDGSRSPCFQPTDLPRVLTGRSVRVLERRPQRRKRRGSAPVQCPAHPCGFLTHHSTRVRSTLPGAYPSVLSKQASIAIVARYRLRVRSSRLPGRLGSSTARRPAYHRGRFLCVLTAGRSTAVGTSLGAAPAGGYVSPARRTRPRPPSDRKRGRLSRRSRT